MSTIIPPTPTPTPTPTGAGAAASYCYQVFGLHLESDCALPELAPGTPAAPGITVRSLAAQEQPRLPATWFGRWHMGDGQLHFLGGRNHEGFVLCFPGDTVFLISPDCKEIRYRRDGTGRAAGFRHSLLDQVIPRTLAQGGHLVLHASSVMTESGTVCFIGHPGRGKSTLAAAFHSEGARLLADDAVRIDASPAAISCAPAYPGVRLRHDAADRFSPAPQSRKPVGYRPGKFRCDLYGGAPPSPYPNEIPLRAILSLRRQPAVSPAGHAFLSRLHGAAAAAELMAHAFRLHVGDRTHLSQILRQAACVAAQIPVYLATYPSDLDLLPRVCAEIARAIDQGSD